MATVHELHTYRLIDREREEAVRVEYHYPDYSVNQRIRGVGATGIYLPIVSYIMMGMFAVIAALSWFSREASTGSGPLTASATTNKSDG